MGFVVKVIGLYICIIHVIGATATRHTPRLVYVANIIPRKLTSRTAHFDAPSRIRTLRPFYPTSCLLPPSTQPSAIDGPAPIPRRHPRRPSPLPLFCLPAPGPSLSTLAVYKARIKVAFAGANPRACAAFWILVGPSCSLYLSPSILSRSRLLSAFISGLINNVL